MSIKTLIRGVLPDTRSEWLMAMFVFAGLLIAGLLVWQLTTLKPSYWCAIAENASPEIVSGCLGLLTNLLTIKDHTIIGLLSILGVTVVSLVVVVLGVKVAGSGPGGVSVDIGSDKTQVEAGGTTIELPTPPSNEEDKA